MKFNSLKYLVAAHQTAARSRFAHKALNASVFDHADVENCFAEIDEIRYPKNSVTINYATKDYLDQYGDLECFHEENPRERQLKPCTDIRKLPYTRNRSEVSSRKNK